MNDYYQLPLFVLFKWAEAYEWVVPSSSKMQCYDSTGWYNLKPWMLYVS